MKRTLILLAAVLCLSLGALTGIHLWVNSARDQVELTETVLAGDPAAAAGVTVTFRTQDQQGHLTWATAFTPGGEPETDFQFSSAETDGWNYDWTEARLETNFAWGMTGAIDLAEPVNGERRDLLTRMAADVADGLEDGGERTETLRLSDYCSTWPVSFQGGWDHIMERYDSETNGFLADYFRIPVDPELEVEVTVKKDPSGLVTEINTGYGPDAPMIDSYGVATAEGAYLAVRVWSENGKARLECPDGPGIHFVPFVEDDPDQWFNPRDLRLFYPTEAEPLYLSLNEDGSKLLLYTQEEDKVVLTVIDRTTAEALQRLELMDMGEDDGLYGPIDQGPLHLVCLGTGEFRLLQEGGAGVTAVLSGSIDREADPQRDLFGLNREPVLAWDGERLIWGAPSNYACTMTLSVWTADGLQFLATYQTGQTRDPVILENWINYWADRNEPLSIEFR